MQMKKQTLGQGAHKHQYFYAVDDYLKDLAFILKVTLLYTWQQLQMIENVLLHFMLFIHIMKFIYFVQLFQECNKKLYKSIYSLQSE